MAAIQERDKIAASTEETAQNPLEGLKKVVTRLTGAAGALILASCNTTPMPHPDDRGAYAQNGYAGNGDARGYAQAPSNTTALNRGTIAQPSDAQPMSVEDDFRAWRSGGDTRTGNSGQGQGAGQSRSTWSGNQGDYIQTRPMTYQERLAMDTATYRLEQRRTMARGDAWSQKIETPMQNFNDVQRLLGQGLRNTEFNQRTIQRIRQNYNINQRLRKY